MLSMMLTQASQASVVAAVPANNIRVLDSAFPAGMPYKPELGFYLEISSLLGMAAGFGLVILKERASKQKSTLRFGVPGYAPVGAFGARAGGDSFGAFRERKRSTSRALKAKWMRTKAARNCVRRGHRWSQWRGDCPDGAGQAFAAG